MLPAETEFTKIEVFPTEVKLRGLDDAIQMVITGTTKSGMLLDLTSVSQYEASDSKILRVTPSGRVVPLSNGSSSISVSFGTKKLQVVAKTSDCDINLPINFANQIVPIFTKLSCNSGGCHGKASGQNNFKLSLLGFDPDLDFISLVQESRGRRVFPASPDNSLLLTKSVGIVPHGGGKKMEVGSDEYRLVRRWIAAGVPYGNPTDAVVTKITIYPENRIMPRNAKQQFIVTAHYTDGTTEDVTRRAQYESNEQDIATVDSNALVRTNSMAGEAAIMVRYQEFVNIFRATVPLSEKPREFAFENNTFVDKFTSAKWKQLGLAPSELCSDEQFIRRLSLDLSGTIPTPVQVKAFVDSTSPNKRKDLVEKCSIPQNTPIISLLNGPTFFALSGAGKPIT